MPILKKCWTPFMIYSYTTIKIGCYYVALYTAVLHLLFICYSLYVIDGGKSDQFYSPYFELDRNGAALAGWLMIAYCFIFMLSSGMLIYGIKHENRCMFYPFMILIVLEILVVICMGIWFLFRYYHNSYTFLAVFIYFCIDGLHVYCLLCVISQYQVIKEFQEPRFVVLHP